VISDFGQVHVGCWSDTVFWWLLCVFCRFANDTSVQSTTGMFGFWCISVIAFHFSIIVYNITSYIRINAVDRTRQLTVNLCVCVCNA